MAEKLGFALVGCGRIAQRYSDIFASGRLPNARLAAVCDVKPERAEKLAQRHGVPAFGDFHRMMEERRNEIDVVCILTESGYHAKHAVELAAYGKPLVVEKPMALTLEDADRMIAACDSGGVKLFIVKQNRYNLPVRKLREALDEGRFGKLVMGTTRVRWCRRQDYYDQDSWRGTWALDGGVFANQASHHVDLLQWCLGQPTSVFARGKTALAKIQTEDTGAAIITFANGALGVIEATTATRPSDLEGSLSILGEKGAVEIGGFAANEMRHWQFQEKLPSDAEVVARFRENPPNVYGFGHIAYLEHVIDAVTNGAPSLVDGLEGRKSLELVTAIYESMATGMPVTIGFGERRSLLGLGA
ncbi:MAG TPA: Gfo/Idh/MocA family oxidoreductase [Xanthobacteraceae bacterium]|nr:Gfo/Idh/MocA family oxidoreductase [Xanthobacteraceae bacterium]